MYPTTNPLKYVSFDQVHATNLNDTSVYVCADSASDLISAKIVTITEEYYSEDMVFLSQIRDTLEYFMEICKENKPLYLCEVTLNKLLELFKEEALICKIGNLTDRHGFFKTRVRKLNVFI